LSKKVSRHGVKQDTVTSEKLIISLENQWAEKVRSGDPNAFESLFRSYYPRLCRFVERIIHSKSIAEEIVQEIFLKIWENRKNWILQYPVNIYLYRAVKNSALNCLKHEKVVKEWEKEQPRESFDQVIDPEEELYQKELLNAVQRAIELLPERCRLIFILHRQDGFTYAEIAFILNISIKTVETQMGRALKTLRRLLSPYFPK
jgi:RNA polymerase sigma-70 factor (ECF subfamily)